MKKFLLGLFFAVFSFFPAFASPADLENAMNLLNEGKTDEAIAIVRTELQNNPNSSESYLAMGIIQLEQNNYSEAKVNLEKALQINRKIVAAHYMLAMIYEKEGDAQRAIEKWGKIVKYSKNENLRSLAEKHIKQLKGELK